MALYLKTNNLKKCSRLVAACIVAMASGLRGLFGMARRKKAA